MLTMDGLDSEPLIEELDKVIDSSAQGKGSCNDDTSRPAQALQDYCFNCMKSSASTGKKELYHRARGTQISPLSLLEQWRR